VNDRPPITIVAHAVGPFGGMEGQLRDLIQGLLTEGHAVTVIARRCQLPPHPRLRVCSVPGPERPFALAYLLFFVFGSWRLWRHRVGIVHATGAIVFNRVDVITVHLCHAAFAERTGILRSSRATPWYRVHARLVAAMSRLGERWCYRPERLRALVAVSPGGAKELSRHFPACGRKVVVIPNGVDTHKYRPAPAARSPKTEGSGGSAPGLALFVAGEWDAKGLEHLIAAIGLLPGWQLLVVGDGDIERFRARAQAAGADDRVEFRGRVEEMAALYRQADVFVLPSAYETFSMVTHEAAASGLPLLATRVSGVEDLLQEGVTGKFIEPEASTIAAGLQAMTDAKLRERMGRAARRRALAFDTAETVRRYSELYLGLTDHPSAGPPLR
jgi:glycosyltransferase involved in cell wall biosynthesis